jgi:uncharacterized membrane protein YtjA (UPF0391 family)
LNRGVVVTTKELFCLQRNCIRVGRLGSQTMLHLVVTLLIIALIAGLLGFGGIAGTAVGLAKIIFFVALVLFVVSLIFGGMRGSFGRRL